MTPWISYCQHGRTATSTRLIPTKITARRGDRLTEADRDLLDDLPLEGLLTTNYKQAWELDPVGNWDTFKWDPDGQSGWTEQDREPGLVRYVDSECPGFLCGDRQAAGDPPRG